MTLVLIGLSALFWGGLSLQKGRMMVDNHLIRPCFLEETWHWRKRVTLDYHEQVPFGPLVGCLGYLGR